jgi:hypothetical protein
MKSPFRQLRIRALGVLAAGAFLALSGSAGQAQTVETCFNTCIGRNLSQATCSTYCNQLYGQPQSGGPRIYGYTSRRAGSCGEFRYLRNGQCVDARVTPPTLR